MTNIEVELYYANKCPNCIEFKPDWNKFKKELNGKIICRQYEHSENKDLIQKRNIKEYPTLRIIVDSNIEEYNGSYNFETLYNYVINKMKNNINNNINNKDFPVKITLYQADWCKYCKLFKPIWDELKDAFIFIGKVNYAEYNSDNTTIMEKEEITTFPTIKITTNGETEIYKGEREFNVLFTYVMKKAGYTMNEINDLLEEIEKNKMNNIKNQQGGKKKDNHFYEKYLKYKAKYLKLKKQQK